MGSQSGSSGEKRPGAHLEVPVEGGQKKRARVKSVRSKAASKASKNSRRNRTRKDREPEERRPQKKDWATGTITTELDPKVDFKPSSTGFIGKRSGALQAKELWTLEQLLANDFTVMEWDGK